MHKHFVRPTNAAQVRRLSDLELESFLNVCEAHSDTGILYQLACDEEIAREERTKPARAKARALHQEDVKWC